ncbi:MAG: hypothetical protein V4463_09670 [Pseudomonadota bacterium]
MNNRLSSLDAFRGFTIAAMVLVNNPGDWGNLYGQLEHAHWNGWTFTDWIFPFFLFIGGVSMALSLGRLADAGADKASLLRKLAIRAGMIFLIGFLLNLVPHFNFATVRIPGVLQRIALCTLLSAPIVLYFSWRGQLAWIAGLLTAYSAFMLSGGPLEPGQDAGAAIDRLLLDGHLWVQSKTWDPEGLASTVPAVCSQLFGVLTGRWLLSSVPRSEQTVWMLLAGLAMLWLGAILDVVLMPINKSLWTPSFAIFMTGWALVLFSAFYWLLDVKPQAIAQRWSKPLVIYGMNALFIFAFSGLVAKMLGFIKIGDVSLGRMLYAPVRALPIGPVNTSLLYAVLFNAAMFAVAWAMWRKKWFVKV